MSAPQNIIAVIFDFDDTLTDDSTSQFLNAYNIDPKEFWERANELVMAKGWEPTLAYLNLILQNIGEEKPFGKLTNSKLREFGKELKFYSGIPDLFNELQDDLRAHELTNPVVEFYIVSGGLAEIIRGSSISPFFKGIWSCEFGTNADSVICSIKRTVSFTEKTRCIFEINKGLVSGIASDSDANNPYSVNKAIDEKDRRIPIRNMIYIGDGQTDVPCFSLIKKGEGRVFGVFDPQKKESPKIAFKSLLAPARVQTLNSPQYGEDDDLGSLLRAAVEEKAMEIDLRTRSAL